MKKVSAVALSLFIGISALSPALAGAEETSLPVRLHVETMDGTLFDETVEVTPCPDTETGTTTTLNAWCAITQTAAKEHWSIASTWFSFGVSLDGINNYTADFANNKFWLWYDNREPGGTALNAHRLSPNEEILLTFNTAPLKVDTSSSSPTIGATTTLTSSVFDSLNWSWVPATDTTFVINGAESAPESDGIYELVPATTDPLSVFVKKNGLVNSKSVTLSPTAAATSTATTTPPEATTTPPTTPPTGGGGGTTPSVTFNNAQAVAFLLSHQQTDGSFGDPLYTDWSAIALGSLSGEDGAKQKVRAALTMALSSTVLTDYERRAMALMALGVNPYSGTSFNYIEKMIAGFDGTQFGDSTLYNDDIFALFPLLKAGYSASDPIIASTTQFILGKQDSGGSFGGVDLTGAALQALSGVRTLPGVDTSIEKAKQYLRSTQKNDGGFGDSFATSWVIQGLIASGENPAQWLKGSNNPLTYISSHQQSDGGLEPTDTNVDSRLWASAYAIPAMNGKSWPSILQSFSKPTPPNQNPTNSGGSSSGGGGNGPILTLTSGTSTATSTASSTLSVLSGTSSPQVASSSPSLVSASTTLAQILALQAQVEALQAQIRTIEASERDATSPIAPISPVPTPAAMKAIPAIPYADVQVIEIPDIPSPEINNGTPAPSKPQPGMMERSTAAVIGAVDSFFGSISVLLSLIF